MHWSICPGMPHMLNLLADNFGTKDNYEQGGIVPLM